MADIGKALRMARLLRGPEGRMLCVPIDHGMQVGPLPGLTDPGPLVDMLVDAGVDAVIVNPGMLARWGHRFAGGPGIILRLDQTTMWRTGGPFGYADTHTRAVVPVEDAVAMGADAVITYLFTCNNDPAQETACMEICGRVATAARRGGVVHVIEAMAAKGGFARAEDPAVVAMHCRIAGELGADLVKTDWCGREGFPAVATGSLAPVAVAGGAALDSRAMVAAFAAEAIAAGAAGLMFGRNVFTRPDARALLAELRAIVHDGAPSR
jgi:DhnA family fructose-bisphosphate aldolase class Ia